MTPPGLRATNPVMWQATNPDVAIRPGEASPRNPWVAAALTLLATGLGQLYAGQAVLAVAFFGLEAGLLLAAGALGLGLSAGGFRTLMALGLSLKASAALLAALAARRRRNSRPGRITPWWCSLAFWAATQLAGIPLAWQWGPGVTLYAVSSSSMEPTLLPGESVMAHTRAYDAEGPARGDIVIFRRPGVPLQLMVKRVVGLPGERVRIQDGQVEALADPAQPPDCSFVLGDNRADSLDSRAFGCVPRGNLVARALFVWSSPVPGRTGMALR